MEEKTLHLPAMRCREMNRLGMRRAKWQYTLSLFTQKAPHDSTGFGAGVYLATVLATSEQP